VVRVCRALFAHDANLVPCLPVRHLPPDFTPILALLDLLLFDREYDPSRKHALFTLIIPIAYVLFFSAAYELTGRLPVPYFFLDYLTYSWLRAGADGIGVVYWVLILSGVIIGLGAAAQHLKNQCQENPVKHVVMVIAVMLGLSLISALIDLLPPGGQVTQCYRSLPHWHQPPTGSS